MFWIVMAVIAGTVFVVYRVIGVFGVRWGMSAERAEKFSRSSWRALAFTGLMLGHDALTHRGGR